MHSDRLTPAAMVVMARPHKSFRHALFRCPRSLSTTRRIISTSSSKSSGTSGLKKRFQIGAIAFAVVGAFLNFNDQVLVTGRTRHLVIPSTIEHAVSPYIRRFKEVSQAHHCPASHPTVRTLNDALLRLQTQHESSAGSPWRVTLVEDWSHAYAACGVDRTIYVSQRMLQDVRSEDELAWVLAHELAHGLARHRWEIAGNMSVYLLLAPLAGVVLSTFVTAMYGLAVVRKSELEADEIGMALMAQSGYSPTAAIDMMSRIEWASVTGRQPRGVVQQIRNFPLLRSHPEPAVRLSRMRTLLSRTNVIS